MKRPASRRPFLFLRSTVRPPVGHTAAKPVEELGNLLFTCVCVLRLCIDVVFWGLRFAARQRSTLELGNVMKGFLLASVALAAFGIATQASAADLAARPYTKAPPPMIAAIYDWSGFYIGANGGWGSSHKCWDFLPVAGGVA